MFYLNQDVELTPELLKKMISKFNLNIRPRLKKWHDYYKGKHDILNKAYADPEKVCNKIITNYCKIITDTYSGYICGRPVKYTSNEDISAIQDAINYNDPAAEDMNWCTNALIYHTAYELFWTDATSQVRFSQVDPLNAFPIYSNTLDKDLLYFVRWYDKDTFDDKEEYILEVYTPFFRKKYFMNGLDSTPVFIEDEFHYFRDVPVSVFTLNEIDENIFNSIITMNDAYNDLQSSEIDEYSAWVDAYLTLEGVDADKDDIMSMKENRVLLLPEGAKAAWLTKNANDTQIVNILENLKKNIFKVTAAPDMADENFLAQSGTALAYKLVGFENVASGIVANFTKAIQRRIELICNILQLKAEDAIWRDVKISFTRNLPVNLTEAIEIVSKLKGIVSDKTLLSLLPFIADVEAELEAIEEQKQAEMELYNFGGGAEETEDEIE